MFDPKDDPELQTVLTGSDYWKGNKTEFLEQFRSKLNQFAESFDKTRPNTLHPILKEQLKQLISEYLEGKGAIILNQYVDSIENLASFLSRGINQDK